MLQTMEYRTAFPILQYYPEVVVVILFCFYFAFGFLFVGLTKSFSIRGKKICLLWALSLTILQRQGTIGFENFMKPFLMKA